MRYLKFATATPSIYRLKEKEINIILASGMTVAYQIKSVVGENN